MTEIQGVHWGYTKALVIVESYTGDVRWAWHMKETQKQNTTFYSQRMMKWPEFTQKSNELWFKIKVNDPISMMFLSDWLTCEGGEWYDVIEHWLADICVCGCTLVRKQGSKMSKPSGWHQSGGVHLYIQSMELIKNDISDTLRKIRSKNTVTLKICYCYYTENTWIHTEVFWEDRVLSVLLLWNISRKQSRLSAARWRQR